MNIVNQLDENRWRAFVDRHPQGNIFHTPEMFAVYARTRGYRPSLWAALEGEDILALHLPVKITLAGGPLALFTSRAVDFGSILIEDSPRGRKALEMLLEAYDNQVSGKILFTELRNSSDLTSVQSTLDKSGYRYEDYENFLIDLNRSSADLMASFDSQRRRHIRQAERTKEMYIQELTNLDQLTLFYELLEKTYQWARVPLADFSLFKAAYEILAPKSMARFAIAYTNGVPASAIVTLNYKDVVLNWYNGTDRAVRPPISNEYLFWDTFTWAAGNGYTTMDLGGAGKPGEKYGVRDFKARYNPRLVSYGRNIRVHAPSRLKLSNAIYQMLRQSLALLKSDRSQTTTHPNEAQLSESGG